METINQNPQTTPSQQPVHLSVLIVEDGAECRLLYEGYFRKMGFDEIHIAKTSSEAQLRIDLDPRPFDLVVLDQYFWGDDLNGTELCRHIRSREDYAATPILMVSGKNNRSTIEEAFRCGADDFLPKPVDPRRLEILAWVAMRVRRHALSSFES